MGKDISQNIIISHVYSSDNKGDAALTSVLIAGLRRQFPGAAITILKLEHAGAGDRFEGIPEYAGFMYYALNKYRQPLVKLAYAVCMVMITLGDAWWWRRKGRHLYVPGHLRQVVRLYEQADLIVPVGGGYLRSRAGLANRLNVPLLLHPLLFGYLLGKPTVLYAQSVGPFQSGFERWITALVLRRMSLIMIREDISLALLRRMGVVDNVMRAVDAGFLLPATRHIPLRRAYHIPADKLVVGVTVRAWLPAAAQARYEKAVASALDTLVRAVPAHILFIPQVTAAKGDDDRIVSSRVFGHMRQQAAATVVVDAGNHHEIKNIYDGLDLLLGTRFHSVIFSLTSFVPVLAIEYEHKTSGIMQDLRLNDWVIRIEDVTAAKLNQKLRQLVQERNQYQKRLRQVVPPYVARAQQAFGALAQAAAGAPQTQVSADYGVVEVED